MRVVLVRLSQIPNKAAGREKGGEREEKEDKGRGEGGEGG